MSDVSKLLSRIQQGDQAAAEQLYPLVYEELRRVAAGKMAAERVDHTLSPTALVHEVYLRLLGPGKPFDPDQHPWNGRAHFFAAAAEAMRRILVDHARNRKRVKRGGEFQRLEIDLIELHWDPRFGDILDLHDALDELERVDAHVAQLVKLRSFAGQSLNEAAALMEISPSTAKRYWAFARAWLYRKLLTETDDSR
jgi:RNA polymerase sigma factor (TIGR02999 family)